MAQLRNFLIVSILVFGQLGFTDKNFDKQLWKAAYDGDLAKVKAAVSDGANINTRGKGGFSPLLAASRNGHLDVVIFLVEHHAEIDGHDNSRKKTPLLAASFKGHFDIVKYLAGKGADINAQAVNGWTPLHDAAFVGNYSIVKFLVEHKANLKIKNKFGETPRETAERALAKPSKAATGSKKDYKKIIDYIKTHEV